jgi:hypothetical protein
LYFSSRLRYLQPELKTTTIKTMKKVFALLFVGTMVTFAACQSKPKTEEAAVDSTATTTMSTDSAAMSTDTTAAAATDSATVAPADSAK